MTRVWRALSQRGLRLLLSAGLISLAGDWVLRVGLAYYGYTLTGSTLASALMLPASFIPQILLSSVAGVYVDRWHHARTMIDYGPAVSIYPDGKVDPAHNSEMDLRLADGSFRLSIAALDKKFVTAAAHEPIYPKICIDLVRVTGTTPIVPGSGTGAYRGIRGSFPVTLTLNEVEASPCQPSPGAFRAQVITVAGSGTVWF